MGRRLRRGPWKGPKLEPTGGGTTHPPISAARVLATDKRSKTDSIPAEVQTSNERPSTVSYPKIVIRSPYPSSIQTG